jgi:predicted NUDIX family NTP pyrophosphohydrolase
MAGKSAGLLLFRERERELEVLLVHPGGPFWAKKDEHAWSIPKGEIDEGEDPLSAALREFAEEIGSPAPAGEPIPLEPVNQPGGKRVLSWALRAEFDPSTLRSNTFAMEWPPRSGRMANFPEVDRAAWFPIDVAARKIHKGQASLLEQLKRAIAPP